VNIIFTCEHAGNTVPPSYGHFFKGQEDVLQSHRGWDPGAVEVARYLSDQLAAPLWVCETTRLLVEPNRSLHNDALFSEYVRALTDLEREHILQQYYHPHRTSVEDLIERATQPTLHLAIHSFTPVLNGVTRTVDVGLLFDPSRKNETEFCRRYAEALELYLPSMSIQFNAPYKGIDDGFPTYLRTVFPDECYVGIEVEINQKYIGTKDWEPIMHALKNGIAKVLDELPYL